jgi:TPR repeat protein
MTNYAGVATLYARAVSWFRKAAEKDDPKGQTNLGTMYRDGLG